MKIISGTNIYVPDADIHFGDLAKRKGAAAFLNYQVDRLEAAYPGVHRRGVAIDVGAHVGLLTRHLAERFDKVLAFEPNPETFACLRANTKHLANVETHNLAVGEVNGPVAIDTAALANSGDRQIVPGAAANAEMITLDSLALQNVGLIKIDVQGYEAFVIEGAMTTLQTWRPMLIVEEEDAGKLRNCFGLHSHDARKRLFGLGAKLVCTISADNIFAMPLVIEPAPYTKYDEFGGYHWRKYERDENSNYRGMVDRIIGMALAQMPQPRRILDVGCGDGLFTKKLERDGAEVVGIDVSAAGVAAGVAHGADCREVSVYDAPVYFAKNKRFDMACLFDVFEHLTDQAGAVAALAQVTDKLCLLNPHPKGSRYHSREFTATELNRYMYALGWTCCEQQHLRKTVSDQRTFMVFRKGTE